MYLAAEESAHPVRVRTTAGRSSPLPGVSRSPARAMRPVPGALLRAGGDQPRVEADASRIEQVLGILLDNGLRHTPAGGQICVDLRREGGETWVSVHDTGEGIPPADLPHVFERFYRGKSDRIRSGGSGLGLAIAQAIIAAHGGRIWAESKDGQGTTITLTLP